jgi:hypothetical protein
MTSKRSLFSLWRLLSQVRDDPSAQHEIKLRKVTQLNIPTGEKFMPLVNVVLVLVVAGVLMWLVNRYIPMQGTIKGLLNSVVVIVIVIWLLKVFGLMGYIYQFHVGH